MTGMRVQEARGCFVETRWWYDEGVEYINLGGKAWKET